jgi:arylsulfatase A-like enzyme
MLTGLIPSHHGAFHHARARLPDQITTLAEILKEEGFSTAAFHGGGQVSKIYGLSQGFDRYQYVENERFSRVVDYGIQWLEETAVDRFFLFLHTYETHVPYQATEYLERFEIDYKGPLPDLIPLAVFNEFNFEERELSEADLLHIINTYDAAVYSADVSLARMIAYLKENGIYDSTLIIFTSDHGEELGEHGKVGYHTHTVFDELLKVPLVIKFAGSVNAGTQIDTQVRTIDILPTILDVTGVEAPGDSDGTSLLPLLVRSREAESGGETSTALQFAVSERDDAADSHHVMSIRTNDSKLYVIKKHDEIVRRMFFDLEDDPTEQENMFPKRQRRADSLWKQFETIKAQRECPPLEPIALDAPTIRRLKELGYTD